MIEENLRPILPSHAMLDVIRSRDVYSDLVDKLENGSLKQEEIETFVGALLEKIEEGKRFRFNNVLSILAVSINDADIKFEDGFYVKELAELNSAELAEASRIAEACIKECSSN